MELTLGELDMISFQLNLVYKQVMPCKALMLFYVIKHSAKEVPNFKAT